MTEDPDNTDTVGRFSVLAFFSSTFSISLLLLFSISQQLQLLMDRETIPF
jgi:hypothetical protein